MAETATNHELERSSYIGQTLSDIPTPSAILDLAKLQVNCQRMLDATDKLGLSWRCHIKAHKTTQLTRLQVGDDCNKPAYIVASTLVEVENIVPLLKEYQTRGREVLFGFPIYQSVVKRLAAVATELGPGALSLMIDHLEQLSLLTNVFKISGHAPLVFLKADTAYARAGVVPGSAACASLIQGLLDLEQRGACVFHGAYAHAGHTVREHEEWEAMSYLAVEFIALQKVAAVVRAKAPDHQFVLSVGATPQTTTIQHPAFCADPADVPEMTTDGRQAPPTLLVEQLFNDLKGEGLELEVHAGVYPTLDLEQLATHARDTTLMKADDIAISILAEVASVYPERGRDKTTEALINAGSLALGRESLQNHGPPPREQYNGWGIVMPWMVDNVVPDEWFPSVHGGWQVGRMSQEHGILVWKGSRHVEAPLQVGQRVRVWPNHSCIAGAGFSQYFIIDSRKGDEIIDVWPRWRGW